MCKDNNSRPNTIEALIDDDMDDSDDEPPSAILVEIEEEYRLLEDEEDSDDYDEETEEGAKRFYTMMYKYVDFAFKTVSAVYSLPDTNQTYESKCSKKTHFDSAVVRLNEANDQLKKLFEMGVEASEMAIFSQMQAHITSKMLELKEIVEGPEWNPALHNQSSE